MRRFVFTGILGAFTTFSTHGLERVNLLHDGEVTFSLANIAASNLSGLTAVFIGFVLARYSFAFISAGGTPCNCQKKDCCSLSSTRRSAKG